MRVSNSPCIGYLVNKSSVIGFNGKVHVYSDFDGTYCPEKHSVMHNPESNPFMINYCKKMNNFLNCAKDDIDFHITTGRTLGEYEAVSWLLKFRDYRLPLPDSLIIKNGSDEFLKKGTDDDFYNLGKFPFNSENTSTEKTKQIKNLTNWNGDRIKKHIKKAAEKVYLKFIEAESENSVKDYGHLSLFSEGKLNRDEWKKMPNDDEKILYHENPIVDFAIGSRNDGKLKINIVFPPDYGYCPFRNGIYDSYINDIRNYLKKYSVDYVEDWEEANNKNHYRKSLAIMPKIDGKGLTKIFDTGEAIKKAMKNNDLVIAAGDGSNDFEMLNPLSYISSEEWTEYAKNSQNPEFYYGDMNKKLKDLKHIYRGNVSEYINDLRKELTQNGLLEKIEQMPFVGIVIKNNNSNLQKLVDTFSQIGKIVKVEKGNIDEGIRIAVKNYAEINSNFQNDMSDNLKDLIYNN